MSIVYREENERLVAEQAVLVYRSVIQAMERAPHGQGLARMEAALMERGREHLRSAGGGLERAVTGHPQAQKKGGARPAVRAAV